MVCVLGIPIFESGEEDRSSKKVHLDGLETSIEDDSGSMMPPNVEAVRSLSFSPTSESDGSNQDYCVNEEEDDTAADSVPPAAEELLNADSSESSENTTDEEHEDSKVGMKHQPNLVLETKTTKTMTNNDDEWIPLVDNSYMSKHELEVLLTPRCMDDYETMAYEEETNVEKERAFRRELIQEELEYLIQATSNKKDKVAGAGAEQFDDDKDDDESLEPEAVEALGIAANQVAYLKKFYDVASCQYIYVPSVAYTILDGSLLEEASKHYFGKEPEFLSSYAVKLCSTIRNQQRLGRIMVEEEQPPSSLTEELDLGDDTNIEYTDARIAKLVWAVTSPKNADDIVSSSFSASSSESTASIPRSFAWDEQEDIEVDEEEQVKIQLDKTSSSSSQIMIKRSLVVAILSVLVLAIARCGCLYRLQDDVATNVVDDVSSSLRHFVTQRKPAGESDAAGQPTVSTTTTRSMASSKKKVTVTKKFKKNDAAKTATTIKPKPSSTLSSSSQPLLPPVGESTALSMFSGPGSPLTVVRGKLGYELHDESQPPKEKVTKNWFVPADTEVKGSSTASGTTSEAPPVPRLPSKPSSIRRPIVPNLLY